VKYLKVIAYLCWPLLTLGCPVEAPKLSGPPQYPDDVCGHACENLERLQCPEAKPVDGGKTCLEFCDQAKTDARLRLHPGCVASATTREELHTCKVRCLQ